MEAFCWGRGFEKRWLSLLFLENAGVGVIGSYDRDSSDNGVCAVCQKVVLKVLLGFRVLN